MFIVVLNGPAGSGKDTIGHILARHYNYEALSFKGRIFEIAKSVLGADMYPTFMALYNNRDTKEKPSELLGGMSPRRFFIRISEEWIKPTFGERYFGEILARQAKVIVDRPRNWGDPGQGMQVPRPCVVTDGGFREEMEAVMSLVPQTRVVRLYREGCSFDGDSRNYVYGLPGFSVQIEEGQPRKAAEYIHSVMTEMQW